METIIGLLITSNSYKQTFSLICDFRAINLSKKHTKHQDDLSVLNREISRKLIRNFSVSLQNKTCRKRKVIGWRNDV